MSYYFRAIRFLVPVLTVFLLNACTEKEIPRFTDKASPDVLKYKIELSGESIISYSAYRNDTMISTTGFIINESEAEKVTKDPSGKIIQCVLYTLGTNGFASASIDSGFSSSGLSITKIIYSYEGNRLHSREVSWRQSGEHPDSLNYTQVLQSESGNCISIKTIPEEYMGCTDYYSYSEEINRLDVDGFSNRLTGDINSRLVKHISWNPDCHFAPSTSTPSSEFAYELDDKGYVVKKVETLTPGYHSGDDEVVRTIKTTYYEYIFH